MPYIGVSPFNGVRRKHTYTATASQTSFSGVGTEGATLSYTDSTFVDVFQNGVKLGEADYTATSGTAIVLAQGASLNDLVEVVVYDVFSVADTVSKSAGGTFDGNVVMAGTLDVTGVATATTFEPDGDTAAGDNAAIGHTAAEGLILTGQGSTSDVTVKNDADATVFTVPTGTDDILFSDNAKILLGAGSDLKLYHDGTNSYIDNVTGAIFIRTNNTETSIKALANAAVEIYHDNTKKLETAATGVTVTGYSHQTAPVVAIIHQNATTSIADNTVTNIPMQASALDTHSLYDATNDRILITSAFNGNYFLFRWAVTITGPGDNMSGFLAKNGTAIQADRKYYVGDEGESITFHGVYFATVATNDYFQVFGFSDKGSGASVSVAGLENSHIFATKLH